MDAPDLAAPRSLDLRRRVFWTVPSAAGGAFLDNFRSLDGARVVDFLVLALLVLPATARFASAAFKTSTGSTPTASSIPTSMLDVEFLRLAFDFRGATFVIVAASSGMVVSPTK